MSEHIDPTAGLDDVALVDATEVIPAVDDDAAWSPVMSVPPPGDPFDAGDAATEVPTAFEQPDAPPMPPVTGDVDAPPPPPGGGGIELGEAPPLPPMTDGGLPPALADDAAIGDAPAPEAAAADAAAVDLGNPPMPPVTGDTVAAPPLPGETSDGPIDLAQPPVAPGGEVDEVLEEAISGNDPSTTDTGAIELGDPPMPPVSGDRDAAPPAAGDSDASRNPVGAPIPAPTPPEGDTGTGNTNGDGSGIGDITRPGQPIGGPVVTEEPQPDGTTVPVPDSTAGDRPGFLDDEPAPTADDVVNELYIRADPGHAPVVVRSLVDDLQRTFPDLPASAVAAYEAAVAEGLTDGGLTWDEHKEAMAAAGLGRTELPSGSGAAVTTALTGAAERGDVISTIVNVGNGPEAFRLSVDGDSVQFESTRAASSSFAVDRATFARAFDAPGAQVLSRALTPLEAPALPDATPAQPLPDLSGLDKEPLDDGAESSFGRNLLIGGAMLLPAAGAATWYATKKAR
jgi:hypothetical protein